LAVKEIEVPIAVGELVDKITILQIKSAKIKDAQRLSNVKKELELLTLVAGRHGIDLSTADTAKLSEVNERLWVVEDKLRDLERAKTFDQEFIELARSVYRINDERFAIKGRISAAYGSNIREEKSYQPY
jgi:hypothetical protein